MARCRLMRAAAHLWARAQSAAGHVVPSYSHPQLGFTSWATEKQRGLGILSQICFVFLDFFMGEGNLTKWYIESNCPVNEFL